MMLEFISYLAMVLTVVGVFYTSRLQANGQLYIFLANCLWWLFAIFTSNWPLAIQCLFCSIFTVQGFTLWAKKGIK